MKTKRKIIDSLERFLQRCLILMSILYVLGALTKATASEIPRIAVLRLDTVGTTELETSIVEKFLRSSFVNSGSYEVLDRENMDKILKEQSLTGYMGINDTAAVYLGKILNVEQIAVGTLMKVKDEYFIEVQMIDVSTSTIKHSKIASCTGTKRLPGVARDIVESITGIAVSNRDEKDSVRHDTVAAQNVSGLTPDDTIRSLQEVLAERKRVKLFRMIGISTFDYNRFAVSGITIPAWADCERKSPFIAGILGPLTFTSGSFYTKDYGTAAFITITKAIGIGGMAANYRKGGETNTQFWIFSGVLIAATVGDAVGAVFAALHRNEKLDKLKSAYVQFSLHIDNNTLSVNYHIPF